MEIVNLIRGLLIYFSYFRKLVLYLWGFCFYYNIFLSEIALAKEKEIVQTELEANFSKKTAEMESEMKNQIERSKKGLKYTCLYQNYQSLYLISVIISEDKLKELT